MQILRDGFDAVPLVGRGAVAPGEAAEDEERRNRKSPNDACSMSEMTRHDYLR
jgi:hypothetical protein